MLTKTIQLERALRQLGWLEPKAFKENALGEWHAAHTGTSACWFRQWLIPQSNGAPYLTPRGAEQVTRLLAAGWTLRSGWPRPWRASVERWLGKRMFVAHSSLFADTVRFSSLISSQVGRYGSGHPEWPQWLDGSLRHVRHQQHRLLIASGTTLAESVEQIALTAGMELARVDWTAHQQLDQWLPAILGLSEISSDQSDVASNTARDTIFLSPTLEPACATLERFPLQDRLSIALADQVLTLTVRDGGKLEELLSLRLQDTEFPTGSVYVTLPIMGTTRTNQRHMANSSSAESAQAWLERGAVGWITTKPTTIALQTTGRRVLGHCRVEDRASTKVSDEAHRQSQQLASPLSNHWRQFSADDDWPYLVHCTRATIGPLPDESEHSFRLRVWSQQEAIAWQPLETLARICRDRRLRGTATITRTSARCVSFSAVPLVPLLKRRIFRSHLGRWDWEPYGLLVRRDALQQLGARQVIYGDEVDFAKLAESDKPFFQPVKRQTSKPLDSWSEEREWRVIGDVPLRELPDDSVVLFVRTQIEARQLSRYAPWPVLWVE